MLASLALFLSPAADGEAEPHPRPGFEAIGTFRGPGTLGWQGPSIQPPGVLVGPGPTTGTERLYLAYTYSGQPGTLDILTVDPATGQWQQMKNPGVTEYGACMILGPDGKIYIGTRPNAHIWRLDPHDGQIIDLGQPAPEDPRSFIYQMAVGSDRKIYACTYPAARLLRCDPATQTVEDLGRLWPEAGEQYGLWIAASKDGYVYGAIGTAQAHLVAYNIASGERRDILASVGGYVAGAGAEVGNTPFVYRGEDGEVYAVAGDRHFRVHGWTMEPIGADAVMPEKRANRLADGRIVEVEDNELRLVDPRTAKTEHRRLGYAGRESKVFRLGAGPAGRIYGSSILPLHLFEVKSAEKRIDDFGRLSHGEVYSFLTLKDKLYMACYDGPDKAPLMIYDPARPFALGDDERSNPRLIHYPEACSDWRPEAMVADAAGVIYIGSVASYGSLHGPLTIWDVPAGRVSEVTGLVRNQSIVTLAVADDRIVGGTTIFGGGGSQPTESEAKLFVWDSARKRKIMEAVPVAHATRLTDFVALPGGKIFGIAIREPKDRKNDFHLPGAAGELFVYDLAKERVEHRAAIPWTPVYNSVRLAQDGKIWGLVREGVFCFDPGDESITLKARAPESVTAGFALMDGDMILACGPTIYRCHLW
jgi:hypothetical protein